jgi:hypothetical protein
LTNYRELQETRNRKKESNYVTNQNKTQKIILRCKKAKDARSKRKVKEVTNKRKPERKTEEARNKRRKDKNK